MLVMIINRYLTKPALENGIMVVEGRESDGVIEWGVGMVLKGRGDGEG